MSQDPTDQHALIFTGPGSQPDEEDGASLDYLEMPEGMSVYSQPDLPEPEDIAGHEDALAMLDRVASALKTYRVGAPVERFDITDLDQPARELVDQILGEGEVSVIAGATIQGQESVLAGVWRVRLSDEAGTLLADTIEIGAFPEAALALAFKDCPTRIATEAVLPQGVANAPALLTELNEELDARAGTAPDMPHVINLTLLPHTEEDLAYLGDRFGPGRVTVLSRGYGNCRVQSTGTCNIWWVQYFNSQDALILNTIEVTPVPLVACAAQEDIDDSAERLAEILEVYR